MQIYTEGINRVPPHIMIDKIADTCFCATSINDEVTNQMEVSVKTHVAYDENSWKRQKFPQSLTQSKNSLICALFF